MIQDIVNEVADPLHSEIDRLRNLLGDAYDRLEQMDHEWECPAGRDDYDCSCGLSELRYLLKEALGE